MIFHELHLWSLLCLPIFIIFGFCMHEYSHAMVMHLYGWDYKLTLYPHKDGDKFYFASCTRIYKEGAISSSGFEFWCHVIPILFDVCLFTLSFILYSLFTGSLFIQTILMYFALIAVIDYSVWLYPFFIWWKDTSHFDAVRSINVYNSIPPFIMKTVSVFVYICMLLLLIMD